MESRNKSGIEGDVERFTHFVCFWRNSPQWARASSFTRFLHHTQRRTTVGRPPLDEWSARCRDLYLTTHNTHNRQISMPPVGFEPTISAGERPQIDALDRAAAGTGRFRHSMRYWQRTGHVVRMDQGRTVKENNWE
jgi:hypothetical protein